ncbi:hypothetical protein [[Mycobacterium] burgundiense]|uniref:Uncharacterized protein n=1 Tax=[Mycobacterium] burgundiense TaxID=3064286 RepID=A0ABM9LKC6_9MYCO|nr:hypothetical protein MU0053_001685 [Mycolicibacterium sp. MU0053]
MIRERVRKALAGTAGVLLLSAAAVMLGQTAGAYPPDPPSPPDQPSNSDLIRAFPVVTPTPSNWTPKFPFPYDQTRDRVTNADITAMSEMCQWYNLQYATLRDQIDRLQFNRIGPDGKDFDYDRDNIQQQVDIVVGNLDKSLAFLGPRVQALTQSRNTFGDVYFPIYEGEAFYKLWEQLSNVNNGIKAHQPAWFTGPSVQKAKRWGSDIHRSHVCG